MCRYIDNSYLCIGYLIFVPKWPKWHPKASNKFKRKVRELTGRSWGVSMQHRLKELNKYLGGWINYFGIANQFQLCVDLDGWIRRRIRQCFWKSWRKVRTKIANLLKLGVYKPLAVACGSSGKSYWHSSKTEGINKGITDRYLRDLGLISLIF